MRMVHWSYLPVFLRPRVAVRRHTSGHGLLSPIRYRHSRERHNNDKFSPPPQRETLPPSKQEGMCALCSAYLM